MFFFQNFGPGDCLNKYLAWRLSVTSLQLTTKTSRYVTLTGHVARLRVLFVLMDRRPAHPCRHTLLGLGAHQTRLAITVAAAQLANTPPIGKQAGSDH